VIVTLLSRHPHLSKDLAEAGNEAVVGRGLLNLGRPPTGRSRIQKRILSRTESETVQSINRRYPCVRPKTLPRGARTARACSFALALIGAGEWGADTRKFRLGIVGKT